MFFCSSECKRISIAVFALPLLVLLFSPKLPAQENWQNRTDSKYSFEEEPRVKLGRWARDLKVGPGMDSAGKRLKGSKFVGQNLQGAVFDDCDLDGVWFVECDLSRASFKGACLTGAAIGICGLKGADFTDATINGLRHSSYPMSEEQLKSTRSYKTKDLSNCTIFAHKKPKYDFQKANLSGATLHGGDFSACDFTNAAIGNISLFDARITAKQLASTSDYKKHRLRYMSFSSLHTFRPNIDGSIDLSGINLTGTKFRGHLLDADFGDAIISKCFFDSAITKAHLCSTKNYREGNLFGIRLWHIDLSGCDLSRQNLTGCEFVRCDFSSANFEDAVITDADFGKHRGSECIGLTLDQIKSTWNYKNNRMEGIVLPKEIAAALEMERKAENNSSEDKAE